MTESTPKAPAPGPARPRHAVERLIVALDFQTGDDALALVDRLDREVVWYKVGMELFYAGGEGLVAALAQRGKRIFLDLKLHDIPNTMAMALRSLARLPVELCTIHLTAGREALAACAGEAERVAATGRAPIGLLGVTRLTSLPPPDPGAPWDDVVALAGAGVECGIYGWIAPVAAVPALRAAHGPGPRVVCPGIRLPEQGRQDQMAVATPEEARRVGADWVVVGRPITRSADPRESAREIIRRLGGTTG
jgi:orotidine-5'-phosphate decarboxylase